MNKNLSYFIYILVLLSAVLLLFTI